MGTDSSAALVARGPGGLHWPLRQGRLRLRFEAAKGIWVPGYLLGCAPRGEGQGCVWQVCSTQATQGRWEGQGKAGSRTVLVVYRTLGSYVGFGVHQIEFATTHSHTHSPTRSPLALLLPSHTTIVFFWITLPGLPCFTQPARHISVSLSFSKTFIASLLSLACHGSAHQRAHHQV